MGEKTSEPVFAGKRKGEKDSTKQFEIKKAKDMRLASIRNPVKGLQKWAAVQNKWKSVLTEHPKCFSIHSSSRETVVCEETQ